MKEIIILVGPPASGKTTMCKNEFKDYTRVNQDERLNTHWKKLIECGEPKLIVDRMNHIKSQREGYLKFAKEHGYHTKMICLDVPYEVCLARAVKRKDHPTIKDRVTAKRALGGYFKEIQVPDLNEADDIKFLSYDPKNEISTSHQ